MNDRLTAAALTLAHIALIGGLAASTLATPAQAQGTLQPVASQGASCAAGWSYAPAVRSRVNTETCYPTGRNAREVYRRLNGEACKPGFNTGTSWCEKAEAVHFIQGTVDALTKTAKSDRCPTGWHTTGAGMTCVTELKQPSLSRAKASNACRANEVDEWNVWCTSNYAGLDAATIRRAALQDYNTMYAYNRGVVATFAGNDLDEKLQTPVSRKMFGDVPAKVEPSAGTVASASNSAPTPSKVCETAEQQGAALGGALGGSRGKALGGLAGAALGGFGKKKSGC